ncbi:MAG: pyruvate kinase [Acidimicrobiia bacterium]
MDDHQPGSLFGAVEALRAAVNSAAEAADVGTLHPNHRLGARNMAAFLALRSEDRRSLQSALAERGLSSLGRCEPHVTATVDAVHRALCALDGRPQAPTATERGTRDFAAGRDALWANAERVLGPADAERPTRIMVTLPSDASEDPQLVDDLVRHGMDLARINCAHDDAVAWRAMAAHVRKAAERHGRSVRIMMDLAGPKLRTGPVPPEEAVVRLHPRRNQRGVVETPALALLVDAEHLDELDGDPGGEGFGEMAVVPVTAPFLRRLVPDDRVRLEDARGATRVLRVTAVNDRGAVVTANRTTYLVDGTRLRFKRHKGAVGPLTPEPGALVLRPGEELLLRPDEEPARRADEAAPAAIGCTLPEAVAALQPDARVLFDDGKITATVLAQRPDGALLRIQGAKAGGTKLRGEKGINVPDTALDVPALTEKDRADLATVAELADLVALSFVRTPGDVRLLLEALAELDATHLGVVLKIENERAFAALPHLLRAAMVHDGVGVMIARGDLAVEVGYERMAELQEEILWLCESAHIPAIWATEVLDQLAKKGRPSRSEITDAAMAHRAECAMLNKGPHVIDAVAALDDILRRMAEHQSKKSPRLRRLRSWQHGLPPAGCGGAKGR